MNEGRILELFFVNGSPDGMLTAVVSNWTGHFLVTPRTQIGEALERKEARRSGIYILLGHDDDQPMAYVGEGENISERIRSHDRRKEWWEKAILITSAAEDLNKSHIKYLEARLISEAQSAKKVKLENSTAPPPRGLTESSRVYMEVFLNNVLMVLPALNIDCFTSSVRSEISREVSEVEVAGFELRMPKQGIVARARVVNGEFIVEKGSTARNSWIGKGHWKSTYRRLHSDLIDSHVLVLQTTGNTQHLIFQENCAFASPSAAATVVLGRSAGSRNWKLQGTDKTYGIWEEEKLADNSE